MNFNNKYFQIKNFRFHFHKWKHNFTYNANVFTERYYKCSKCPEVMSETSGYILGRFRKRTGISSMEKLETFQIMQEMLERERKQKKKKKLVLVFSNGKI